MERRPHLFSIKKIIILAGVLILPGFCYYLLQEKGQNRYKSLPIYGEKKLTGTFHSKRGQQIPDTAYHAIQPFDLLDTEGKRVTFDPDSGVSVVSFFYTGNQELADAMQSAMQRVATRFAKNRMVSLFSITVDPLHDKPDKLAAYRKKWGMFPHWEFLSIDSAAQVKAIAQRQFLLDVVYPPKPDLPIVHSSRIVLVDSQHRIRGYYDAIVNQEVDQLIDEVTLLLTEEYRNISVNQYGR